MYEKVSNKKYPYEKSLKNSLRESVTPVKLYIQKKILFNEIRISIKMTWIFTKIIKIIFS